MTSHNTQPYTPRPVSLGQRMHGEVLEISRTDPDVYLPQSMTELLAKESINNTWNFFTGQYEPVDS